MPSSAYILAPDVRVVLEHLLLTGGECQVTQEPVANHLEAGQREREIKKLVGDSEKDISLDNMFKSQYIKTNKLWSGANGELYIVYCRSVP